MSICERRKGYNCSERSKFYFEFTKSTIFQIKFCLYQKYKKFIYLKANVSQLKSFLKIVHLAANNPNFNDESLIAESKEVDLNKENKQMKKPLTSISIKSRKDYLNNFRAIISQNMSIKSKLDNKCAASLNLLRLTINEAEIKYINKSMFELKQLVYLDLSNNNIEVINDFSFDVLEELILTNNKIKFLGEYKFSKITLKKF